MTLGAGWTEKKCLFCGENCDTKVKYEQNFNRDDLNADTFSARRSTDHYHYRFLECKKTRLVFSSPILSFEEISAFYRQSLQNYDGETPFIAASYLRYIKTNPDIFKQKDTALEIGCGSGFFLDALKSAGYKNVTGVEPSEEAVSKAGSLKKDIFCGTFEEAKFSSGQFDLVCCFQTLDHLVDPGTILKKVYEVLKPGGIGYFIVHNEKGLQARLFGERSPIYDVEHIYLFNKQTLPRFFEQQQFKVLRVFDVKNVYPLRYWVRMSPLPGKKIFNRLDDLTGIGNMKLGIYPGNQGILVTKY